MSNAPDRVSAVRLRYCWPSLWAAAWICGTDTAATVAAVRRATIVVTSAIRPPSVPRTLPRGAAGGGGQVDRLGRRVGRHRATLYQATASGSAL